MTTKPIPQRLRRDDLKKILQANSVDALSVADIVDLFRGEKDLSNYLPDAVCQMDPRDGTLILYNSARARRPHDQVAPLVMEAEARTCPICQGLTTGVIDVADLSQGFTFINKNLFPILHMMDGMDPRHLPRAMREETAVHQGMLAYGLHFLQWTSSYHDKDWHNMPLADRVIVLERLAALEKKLLLESEEIMPATEPWMAASPSHGFVSIIKNYGKPVGGSLAHGHQQIAFSNVMPHRIYNNLAFLEQHGEVFSKFMLRENPAHLLVRDYGEAILIVPYFMRRPYDMMILIKDTEKQYLSELTRAEKTAVAKALHDGMRAIMEIMPLIDKETAFNLTVNNGPGAGLYFEFLPYTQELGGFEKLGLWVCHDTPENVVNHLRHTLDAAEKLS